VTTEKTDLETTPEKEPDRRFFVALASTAFVGLAGLLTGILNLFFLRPRVTYGSSSKVRVGKPGGFAPGSITEFPEERIVVRRDGNRFAAISTVCTHLGCTVASNGVGFACPCHGSVYDEQGNVVNGPAPKALSWFKIVLAPNGELEVNKQDVVEENTYLNLEMRV
jgi:cytochrome b6-f complex iron-sulfur subunit